MSTDFIERYADTKKNIFSTKQTKSEQIAKLSHLFMSGKRISSIGDLSICRKNIRVIYLHNNLIRAISNLQNLNALTHLYLQNNRIEEISNLNGLPNLTKLYLGMNEIKILTNLKGLPKLKELHVERQRLQPDEEFAFDDLCLDNLSNHLQLINISGLQLTTLDLSRLQKLKHLLASDNRFTCPIALGKSLESLVHLRNVRLHGCPAQKNLHYREHILEAADQIDMLDGKAIPRSTRTFIKEFATFKTKQTLQNMKNKSSDLSRQNTGLSFVIPHEDINDRFSIHEVSFDAPKVPFKLNRNIRRLPVSAMTIRNPVVPKITYERNNSCVSDQVFHKIDFK